MTYLATALTACAAMAVSAALSAVAAQPASRTTPPSGAAEMREQAIAVLRALNPAEVAIELSPGTAIPVGEKISFRVTSRKPGYLLLVDIDPVGKISQVFPSPELLMEFQQATLNFVKAGGEIRVPSSEAIARGFQYVVTPPAGEAMIVAVLSEQPVQILDLPDLHTSFANRSEVLAYLAKWMAELRIPDPRTGQLSPARWSFDAKTYVIK